MKFQKGQSGNPAGRPRGATSGFTLTDLRKAIEEVEIEKKKPFLKHAVERAYEDDRVLIALLGKMLPQATFDNEEDSELMSKSIEFLDIPHNGDGRERFKEFIDN